MRAACLSGAAALLLCAAAACSSGGGSASSAPTSAITKNTGIAVAPAKPGGSLTVLEVKGSSGDWPLGLDPATNATGSVDQDYYDAVYGQLFELGAGGKLIDDLATGYTFSNGSKTITITLRPNVSFSDGTPLTAAVVAWNWTRDLESTCTCSPASTWPIAHADPKVPASPPAPGVIKVLGPLTVQVNLAAPDGAFINQMFDSIPNWIISESSFSKMGEAAFARLPVGAGPFIMVSDSYSDQIVMKRNPGYWDRPLPYLDNLTFKSVNGDQSAYEAMLAGEAQVYTDMSTPQLLAEAARRFDVLNQLGTSPLDLQLNTAAAPFNNAKARQALYAMTDFAPIMKNIFLGDYPVVEGFTGPGGICYQPSVPGYQGYSPGLARKLVTESGLDKVTINLGTLAASPLASETTQALAQEWAQFGVRTTLHAYPLNGLIQAFLGNGGKSWQAMIESAGSYDPAGGIGVGGAFMSTSPFSGVHDPRLDQLLNEALVSNKLSSRCPLYDQAERYIAKNYYAPFYLAFAPSYISVKGVGGPGLSEPLPPVVVRPAILWEDVYYNPSGS